jgi:hypothetical protein
MEQMPRMNRPAGSHSRYLCYWWKPRSKINPDHFSGKYYRVFHDRWWRYIRIETYEEGHQLTRITEFTWKGIFPTSAASYSPSGDLEYYRTYHRKWYGGLVRIVDHFPDGTTKVIDPE